MEVSGKSQTLFIFPTTFRYSKQSKSAPLKIFVSSCSYYPQFSSSTTMTHQVQTRPFGSPSSQQVIINKSSELEQSELVQTRNSMPKSFHFYFTDKLFLDEKSCVCVIVCSLYSELISVLFGIFYFLKLNFTHIFLIIIITDRSSGMCHVPGLIDGHLQT